MKIQLIKGERDIDVTSLTLLEQYGDNWKMFNCPTCKNPIFQYKGRLISIIPGFIPTETPVVIQCSNSNCRQKYFIKTMVRRVI